MDTNTLAEAEFAHVAAQLTDAELMELDWRVVEGEIEGRQYIFGECGCFYGTVAILRGEVRRDTEPHDIERIRNKFLDGTSIIASGDFGITPLEDVVYRINIGDTPDTDGASAWLHSLLQAELQRRQEVRS